MDELQAFIMLILKALIVAAVPVITRYVIVWLQSQRELVLSRLSAEQRALLVSLVVTLVQAAEQAGVIGLLEDTGKAKKRWVIEQVQRWLDQHGLPLIDAGEIGAMIEAAINQGVHQSPPPLINAAPVLSELVD